MKERKKNLVVMKSSYLKQNQNRKKTGQNRKIKFVCVRERDYKNFSQVCDNPNPTKL